MSGKNKTARREESADKNYIRILIGSAVSAVIYFLLVAMFALISLKNGVSSAMYVPAGIFFAFVSGFTGGFITVRPIKAKGIFYGTVSGLISAIICSVVHFIANGNKAGSGLLILAGAMIVAAAAGGITAVNLKVKNKY